MPVTGLIIAKLDGTARGGAVCQIVREIELPVRYVGTGEQLELLEAFEPASTVDAIVVGRCTAVAHRRCRDYPRVAA